MSRGRNFQAVIGVGRMNPPTRGHDVMIQTVCRTAVEKGAKPIIYVIDGEKSGKDKTKNPLTGKQRFDILTKLYPGVKFDVVENPFQALEILNLQGIEPIGWVAGSDRTSNYRKLVSTENLDCEIIEVDREAGEADGVSATLARKAALEQDLESFSSQMSPMLSDDDLANIANLIKESVDEQTITRLQSCRRHN